MSTDIYGVRVLDVDPKELRVRFRVFAVYYDTGSRSCPPVPDDLGFFFFLLWEAAQSHAPAGRRGSPARMLDVDTMLDFAWVDANARRFVSRIERIAVENHPPTPGQWQRLHDFYYERGGVWKDEDLLAQFEYDVWVTDERWMETLAPGDAWGTTIFPLNADTWTANDAPHIPDLAQPVRRISPFAGKKGDFDHRHVHVGGMDAVTAVLPTGRLPCGHDGPQGRGSARRMHRSPRTRAGTARTSVPNSPVRSGACLSEPAGAGACRVPNDDLSGQRVEVPRRFARRSKGG